MNPAFGEVTTWRGNGFVSTFELTEEVMMERSKICIPLFEKRIKIMMMRPSEKKPPVAVVYYFSLLKLMN